MLNIPAIENRKDVENRMDVLATIHAWIEYSIWLVLYKLCITFIK